VMVASLNFIKMESSKRKNSLTSMRVSIVVRMVKKDINLGTYYAAISLYMQA
jgi:hypothetical protein